jgi:hypothetical protein
MGSSKADAQTAIPKGLLEMCGFFSRRKGLLLAATETTGGMPGGM